MEENMSKLITNVVEPMQEKEKDRFSKRDVEKNILEFFFFVQEYFRIWNEFVEIVNVESIESCIVIMYSKSFFKRIIDVNE